MTPSQNVKRDTSSKEVTPHLPDSALPDADWADAFEIQTATAFPDMRSLAQSTVGAMPPWSRVLLRLRNLLVAPFGLKSGGAGDVASPSALVDIFPVLEESENRIVLGLNDRHLDFRIVLERDRSTPPQRVRLTTLVQRHNLFGRAYIAAITPFHRAVATSVLRGIG